MFSNLCRICLENNENVLVDIFNSEKECEYANGISFCSGVEISPFDSLPQKVCEICLSSVLAACIIKEKCLETDRILRQRLSQGQVLIEDNLKPDAEVGNFVSTQTNPCGALFEQDIPAHKHSKQRRKSKNTIKCRSRNEDSLKISRSKSKTEDFRCFICDKVFKKISTKNQHVKSDHQSELSCKVCNAKKPSSLSTEKCLRDHKIGFDFLCQICAKPFRHKYYLLKHQTTFHADITNAEVFTCDLCGLQTKYKMNLYRHVKSVHLNSSKFPCPHGDTCNDIVYTTKEGLNIHLYRVHGVKAPITCSSCNLGFSFSSELKIHRKICAGVLRTSGSGTKNKNFKQFCEVIEDGFKCKVCQKIFSEKQNWSYHYSSTHRDNRTCEICNKEFTNYTNYYRHVNVQHRKIKKFRCEFPGCEKSFGQKGSLINHKNTHTGEKPFACSFCSFRSGDKSTVIKHKKKLHGQQQPQQPQFVHHQLA